MIDFFMGALGFSACAAAFFAGIHYGARDRPAKAETDKEAVKKAETEKRYTENFFSYTGDNQ